MRIIDRYILKEALIPILLSLYTLIFLFLIGDVFDNLSEIINNKVPVLTIVAYYFYLIPLAYIQTVSWAVFLGTLFVFCSLTRNSEIIALKACGLKTTTIALPVLYLGLIFSAMTFAINDRVVPFAFEKSSQIKKESIEISTIKNKTVANNITLLANGRQYFIKDFYLKTNTVKDIRIHILDNSNNVIKKITAQEGKWENGRWILTDVNMSHLDNMGDIIGSPSIDEEKEFPEFRETPREFIEANFTPEFMSIKDMSKQIDRKKANKLNTYTSISTLHNKIALPWQSFIVMILSIPILLKSASSRYGISKNIFISLFAILCFHIARAVCLAIGSSGFIHPSITAWIANLGAVGAGLYMFKQADY